MDMFYPILDQLCYLHLRVRPRHQKLTPTLVRRMALQWRKLEQQQVGDCSEGEKMEFGKGPTSLDVTWILHDFALGPIYEVKKLMVLKHR